MTSPSDTLSKHKSALIGLCLAATTGWLLLGTGCSPADKEAATPPPAENQAAKPTDLPETASEQLSLSQGLNPAAESAEALTGDSEAPNTPPPAMPKLEGSAMPTSASKANTESAIKEMSASVTDLIAKASGKTPKAELFVFEDAAAVPGLAEGGFATEPAFVENFDYGWEKQTKDWQVATWTQNQTKMGRERAKANEDGHLVLTVKAGYPKLGGSIQSKGEFGYGRWVARVRPSSVPGVLNSVFTKDWDDKTTPDDTNDGRKAEVDFEFLTYTFGPDSGEIHLAIHLLKKHPLWHVDIPLNFNPSDEFREWGFDILPDKVVWHVDGKLLFAWEYTDDYYIDPMYEFFFNAWTKKTWIQGPPEEDADYHIDWLKFYPY